MLQTWINKMSDKKLNEYNMDKLKQLNLMMVFDITKMIQLFYTIALENSTKLTFKINRKKEIQVVLLLQLVLIINLRFILAHGVVITIYKRAKKRKNHISLHLVYIFICIFYSHYATPHNYSFQPCIIHHHNSLLYSSKFCITNSTA